MVLAQKTWRRRQLIRQAKKVLRDGRRYIDFALEVRVVDRDPNGTYKVPGADGSFRIIESHRCGGKLDTVTKSFVAPAENYLTLHASPKQWQAISANLDPDGQTIGTLVFGGEGSGKSEQAAIWALWIIVTHSGIFAKPRPSIGATAPTTERLDTFLHKITERIPSSWATLKAKKGDLVFANGLTINFRGTKKYSDDVGSRIQGFTWFACVSDEAQDYDEDIDSDIEARGRGAPNGRYLRFVTATPKDSTRWRNYVELVQAAKDWSTVQVIGPENVFVPLENWERMRRRMTDREYRRRALGENLRPERATYYAFHRKRNCKRRPLDSRRDLTKSITGSDLVLGHDPGIRQDVTVLLKAYRLDGIAEPVWFVVDEVVTERSNTTEHVNAVADKLAERWHGSTVIGHPDPNPGTEEISADNAIRLFAAAGIPMARPQIKQIKKKDRIDMLNGLCLNVNQVTRLYLDIDELGQHAAPYLLKSFETEVRDELGKAESGKKDESDFSHAPAATAFALYRYERPQHGFNIRTAPGFT